MGWKKDDGVSQGNIKLVEMHPQEKMAVLPEGKTGVGKSSCCEQISPPALCGWLVRL
jgi:predicted GTPase